MIARKQLPPELEEPYRAFLRVLEEIEPAKAGLADVLPGTRLPGRPLNDAVEEYVSRLVRAKPTMRDWQVPALEPEWRACSEGLERAVDRGRRVLALDREPEGFEGLLGAVEYLMDPLDPFVAAAERFRRLRRRSRGD